MRNRAGITQDYLNKLVSEVESLLDNKSLKKTFNTEKRKNYKSEIKTFATDTKLTPFKRYHSILIVLKQLRTEALQKKKPSAAAKITEILVDELKSQVETAWDQFQSETKQVNADINEQIGFALSKLQLASSYASQVDFDYAKQWKVSNGPDAFPLWNEFKDQYKAYLKSDKFYLLLKFLFTRLGLKSKGEIEKKDYSHTSNTTEKSDEAQQKTLLTTVNFHTIFLAAKAELQTLIDANGTLDDRILSYLRSLGLDKSTQFKTNNYPGLNDAQKILQLIQDLLYPAEKDNVEKLKCESKLLDFYYRFEEIKTLENRDAYTRAAKLKEFFDELLKLIQITEIEKAFATLDLISDYASYKGKIKYLIGEIAKRDGLFSIDLQSKVLTLKHELDIWTRENIVKLVRDYLIDYSFNLIAPNKFDLIDKKVTQLKNSFMQPIIKHFINNWRSLLDLLPMTFPEKENAIETVVPEEQVTEEEPATWKKTEAQRARALQSQSMRLYKRLASSKAITKEEQHRLTSSKEGQHLGPMTQIKPTRIVLKTQSKPESAKPLVVTSDFEFACRDLDAQVKRLKEELISRKPKNSNLTELNRELQMEASASEQIDKKLIITDYAYCQSATFFAAAKLIGQLNRTVQIDQPESELSELHHIKYQQ